jgi:hypothetical protein
MVSSWTKDSFGRLAFRRDFGNGHLVDVSDDALPGDDHRRAAPGTPAEIQLPGVTTVHLSPQA